MSSTPKLQLGFSPVSKKIVLAMMKEHKSGMQIRVGNKPPRDVTEEAAQIVWQLVMSEGGEILWEREDGMVMALTAELREVSNG